MNILSQLFGTHIKNIESKKEVVEEQREMIEGVEHLPETIVRDVMVPRTDTVCVEDTSPIDEILETFVDSGHSRIPVYSGTIDNIVGILYAKDVLAALVKKRPLEVKSLMRLPYFVPETKRIDTLLKEFKRRHVHIAIAVDEYGGTAGIISLEDIIEEIVGEIQDEFDEEAEQIVLIGKNRWSCDARIHLEDLNDVIGAELPYEEYDSLAGYVFDLFERIPSKGEQVTVGDLQFTVEEMEGHRLTKICIEKLDMSQEDSPSMPMHVS
ncbi:MAG TPA: hemolysin family protein [Rectinema sp.]|jgi:CBS domain containing-hemolysin-like protein|nr:hemolysin family protein [Spirochaetota bacterium]OQC74622.1 MAG: Magnesium and cobalt efflux protein CorC [Spirochaetes bacterium ADurb.Bin001]HNP93109.1 hemolysin family protein [Rectinema sp.]HNT59623.1 hemolysin family protein [Rectinema sp.]HNZ93017.1 hemolysin family protein [Rectinema sp.]